MRTALPGHSAPARPKRRRGKPGSSPSLLTDFSCKVLARETGTERQKVRIHPFGGAVTLQSLLNSLRIWGTHTPASCVSFKPWGLCLRLQSAPWESSMYPLRHLLVPYIAFAIVKFYFIPDSTRACVRPKVRSPSMGSQPPRRPPAGSWAHTYTPGRFSDGPGV